ncbi:MAG TPA: hypothetical protein EYG73_12845 [Arcobacter sp.]|nr:hypothetical protein [Arcobacter sp.]
MYNNIKNMKLNLETTESASQTDIELFEKELSFKLGEEYKNFLIEFGTLEVGYLEFYGFFKDNLSLPSAIYATKYMRETIDDFDKKLVVFYESGDGSYYSVDSSDYVYHCTYNRCTNCNMKFKEFIFSKLKEI